MKNKTTHNNFKRNYRLVCIGSLAILIICFLAFRVSLSHRAAGLQQLAKDFRFANKAATIEPMLELYFLDGSNNLNITQLKGALQSELGLPIEKIEFEPLSGAPEETIRFTHKDIRYGPTLQPRYRMRVVYKSKDRLISMYTIGKTPAGKWKFTAPKPVSEWDG